jgi:hypothetical protein
MTITMNEKFRQDSYAAAVQVVEDQIRALAGTIACQADAIAEGTNLTPLAQAKLILNNADTLVHHLEYQQALKAGHDG